MKIKYKNRMVEVEIIKTKEDFIRIREALGVSPSWHEPDEQEVTIKFTKGKSFDNCHCSPQYLECSLLEHGVIILQDKIPVAWVNLALLFSFIS